MIAWLLAVVLIVVLVGLLIIVYYIVNPTGALTVTYQRQGASTDAVAVRPASDDETKTCPDCAESVMLAARICRHCRYEFWAEGEDPYEALRAREQELARLTEEWTRPALSRTYEMTADGDEDAKDDDELLGVHGYAPQDQSVSGSRRSVVYHRLP